jgi:hypothetical protein
MSSAKDVMNQSFNQHYYRDSSGKIYEIEGISFVRNESFLNCYKLLGPIGVERITIPLQKVSELEVIADKKDFIGKNGWISQKEVYEKLTKLSLAKTG